MQAATTTTQGRNGHRSIRPAPNPYGGNFLLSPSLADYLTPDVALPEQYFSADQIDDGLGAEKALMYAVLKDGIRCFYKNVGAKRRKYKKMFDEAEEWISQDTYDYPFAFSAICDTLGIDAKCLRERLLEWKEAEMMRRALTGDTASIQVGRSPFPAPVDLSEIEVMGSDMDDGDTGEELEDGDDWDAPVSISLDDLAREERLVHAA